MSKISRLIKSYSRFISVPWHDDAAPPQRVIFCVYDEGDELPLRVQVEEFEIVTKAAGHHWTLFDLTNAFESWLTSEKYSKSYFQKPHLLGNLLPRYLDYITCQFENFLSEKDVSGNSVVALIGVGSLFGFLKAKDVVDRLAPQVPGRLVVFFPGTFENNNYRLLDGYDGWNYLAVPITADKEF
ncbi:MAG: DUF1788 domain-containing protein [Deltaproteobacteria bacterium]|nr:DUF1788 domain-containing protein [Deltaproteobacteria bacterium]